jgi:hypothetical protein
MGGGGRGVRGGGSGTSRPAAPLIAFGERERERGSGKHVIHALVTNCTHAHVVFPSISLSYISVLL